MKRCVGGVNCHLLRRRAFPRCIVFLFREKSSYGKRNVDVTLYRGESFSFIQAVFLRKTEHFRGHGTKEFAVIYLPKQSKETAPLSGTLDEISLARNYISMLKTRQKKEEKRKKS